MKIEKIDIRYSSISSFDSMTINNVRHIKILPWLSIVQAVEGNYDVILGNRSLQNTGNNGFFIAPSDTQQIITHHAYKKSGRFICRWVFLDIFINEIYRLDTLYDFPTLIPSIQTKSLNSLFDELFSSEEICDRYSCFYRIIGVLLQLAKPKKTSAQEDLTEVLQYIKTHYREKIGVHLLAKLVHRSEANFYSIFKKSYGSSPIVYLNRYRLSLASELLVNTNSKIVKIAESVGIPDPAYFNRQFHNAYQASPFVYRKLHKNEHSSF